MNIFNPQRSDYDSLSAYVAALQQAANLMYSTTNGGIMGYGATYYEMITYIRNGEECDGYKEVRKILLKHYRGENGTVSSKEILNMFDVMRTGSKSFNDGNYVYRKKYVKHGNVYFIVVKLFSNGKDAVLKSFYSNVGYK